MPNRAHLEGQKSDAKTNGNEKHKLFSSPGVSPDEAVVSDCAKMSPPPESEATKDQNDSPSMFSAEASNCSPTDSQHLTRSGLSWGTPVTQERRRSCSSKGKPRQSTASANKNSSDRPESLQVQAKPSTYSVGRRSIGPKPVPPPVPACRKSFCTSCTSSQTSVSTEATNSNCNSDNARPSQNLHFSEKNEIEGHSNQKELEPMMEKRSEDIFSSVNYFNADHSMEAGYSPKGGSSENSAATSAHHQSEPKYSNLPHLNENPSDTNLSTKNSAYGQPVQYCPPASVAEPKQNFARSFPPIAFSRSGSDGTGNNNLRHRQQKDLNKYVQNQSPRKINYGFDFHLQPFQRPKTFKEVLDNHYLFGVDNGLPSSQVRFFIQQPQYNQKAERVQVHVPSLLDLDDHEVPSKSQNSFTFNNCIATSTQANGSLQPGTWPPSTVFTGPGPVSDIKVSAESVSFSDIEPGVEEGLIKEEEREEGELVDEMRSGNRSGLVAGAAIFNRAFSDATTARKSPSSTPKANNGQTGKERTSVSITKNPTSGEMVVVHRIEKTTHLENSEKVAQDLEKNMDIGYVVSDNTAKTKVTVVKNPIPSLMDDVMEILPSTSGRVSGSNNSEPTEDDLIILEDGQKSPKKQALSSNSQQMRPRQVQMKKNENNSNGPNNDSPFVKRQGIFEDVTSSPPNNNLQSLPVNLDNVIRVERLPPPNSSVPPFGPQHQRNGRIANGNGGCCEDIFRSPSDNNMRRPNRSKGQFQLEDPSLDELHSFKSRYIDSHCHLDYIYGKLKCSGDMLADWKEKYSSAFPSNFEGCIPNFCDPYLWCRSDASEKSLTLYDEKWIAEQARDPLVLGTSFGCHPHNYQHYDKQIHSRLNDIARSRMYKIVAIGECGIDLAKNDENTIPAQISSFKGQLNIARENNLPIVIHCRGRRNDEDKAEQICLQAMRECLPHTHAVHRHCYTGSLTMARRWCEAFPNIVFGFTSFVSNMPRESYEFVQAIPTDMFVLETDAPYFLPISFKETTRNQKCSLPGMCISVAHYIAQIKGRSVEEILELSNNNTRRIYRLPRF